jgi:hypothetical protein
VDVTVRRHRKFCALCLGDGPHLQTRGAATAGGREARGQGLLVDLLFWVTLIIVAGALIGNWLGIMGYLRDSWFWFGNQGLSYIQLGRFWQIGFFAGLLIWSALVFRALWPTVPIGVVGLRARETHVRLNALCPGSSGTFGSGRSQAIQTDLLRKLIEASRLSPNSSKV